MTEVTSYPRPHRLGAPSHRRLAPAPAPAPGPFSFFIPDILPTMSFSSPPHESYSEPLRPSMGPRSSSVSSTSSSTSYRVANSRTLSPALTAPESAVLGMGTARNQQPLVHRALYPSQSPYLFSSPSQYLPSQASATQYSPCASAPATRYTQGSPFDYRQRTLPSQPSPMSYQTYAPAYQPYGALPYHAPSELIPSYPHPVAQLQEQVTQSILGTAALPPEVLRNITKSLGYLDVIRLSQVNKCLHARVDPLQVPDQDKIYFVLTAEREYERYSLRASSTSGVGQGGRDSGHLSCYHCFKIKGPSEFELFRYNGADQAEDSDTDASTPSQKPPPTSNPHYDPSLTRSSIVAKGKSGGSGSTDQSSPRVKETLGIRRFCIECGVRKGYYKPGALIELRSEKPGKERRGRKDDKEGREAKWICNCLKIHKKPDTLHCPVCGLLTPFSQNRGVGRANPAL